MPRILTLAFFILSSVSFGQSLKTAIPDTITQQQLINWWDKFSNKYKFKEKELVPIKATAILFRQKSIRLNSYDSHYIFIQIGNWYYLEKKYDEAEYWLKLNVQDLDSKAIKNKTGDIFVILRDSYNLLANIQKNKTDYAEAIKSGHLALKYCNLVTKLKIPYDTISNQLTIGRTYLNLSNVYRWKKQYDSAEVYAHRVTPFLKISSEKDKYEFNFNWGLLYGHKSYLQDVKKSIAYLDKAYGMSKNAEQKLRVIQWKVRILLLNKQFYDAQTAINDIELVQKNEVSDFFTNQTYIIQGDVFRLKGLLKDALISYEKAIEIYQKGDYSDNLRASLYGKYQVLVIQRKYQEALIVGKRIDESIDTLRNNYESEDSKLFLISNQYAFYESALEACYIQHDTASAFRFIEKSRAVLLMEHLTYQEKEKENKKPIVSNLAAIKDSLQRHHQTLVSYFVGDSAVYAYCIANGHTKFLKLAISPQVLATLTDSFYTVCTKSQYKWYERLWATVRAWFGHYNYFHEAFEVYQTLFEPLGLPKGINVLVSFDGRTIPFEAFLQKDVLDSENFLLNDFTFSYTYSASYWAQALGKAEVASQQLLAVVPIAFDNQPTLSGGDAVVASLRKLNYQVKELRENQATTAHVLAAIQGNYGTVYFHTHAQADAAKNIAELYLYQHDTLQMAALMQDNIQIKANLVVLTACQTAVGTTARGEGVMSLARGFAYAGVPSTIASTWSIPEAASTKISEMFFENLKQQQPRSRSLAASKRAFVKGNPDQFMPIFWAGLVLIGK